MERLKATWLLICHLNFKNRVHIPLLLNLKTKWEKKSEEKFYNLFGFFVLLFCFCLTTNLPPVKCSHVNSLANNSGLHLLAANVLCVLSHMFMTCVVVTSTL